MSWEHSFMNEVDEWNVDEIRRKLRELPNWDSPEALDIDRDLVAHGAYCRTLEDHLEQAQRMVVRLNRLCQVLSEE